MFPFRIIETRKPSRRGLSRQDRLTMIARSNVRLVKSSVLGESEEESNPCRPLTP
ncbi:hypothetical protein psageK4_059c [Pseudomonas phage psageK4]|uniref:Uncharacterized protein n=2 Tax=Otagovirus TaxID=2560197 RepID=A0AAE8XMH5_9CAUD|nr:hypothetical protein QGX14_gp176 [Pseudomonas phage psageK4]YP_010766973.1 hypothetical protein QGX15_gp179 [Pseudomonas phage psageK4e]QXV71713.1 hypothetical protein psageK4_059c [Pseudomonas phage psageK4]UAW53516.1 hypothetical protein psageK4e_068c [Pseudomonas phage psageK4e]